MEEQKQKCRECRNCWHYTAYYTKGYRYFDKTRTGCCRKSDTIVDNRHSCGQWTSATRYISSRHAHCKKALQAMLDDLSAIRQILEEESKDEL